MDLPVALVNAFVVVAVGSVLAYLTNDRFKALSARIDRVEGQIVNLRSELKGDFARMEARLDARITRLETRMDSLGSDLTQVALAVGARRATAEG